MAADVEIVPQNLISSADKTRILWFRNIYSSRNVTTCRVIATGGYREFTYKAHTSMPATKKSFF